MRRVLAGAAFMLAAFPFSAEAACLTCSCTVGANPLSFGAFNPLAGPMDAVGSVEIDCIGLTTSLDSMTIELSTGGSGAYGARRLRNGANTLPYQLYSDPTRMTVWGDGTGGSSALVVQNQLSLLIWRTTQPVYGRIPEAPTARPGSYSDTIVVSVEW